MRAFFIKVKNWIVNHIPSRRRIIQLYAFLLYNANSKGYIDGQIYVGNTKYVCVPGMNCYSCPGAIGACPLGSLQNALNASGSSTAYYVLGSIALFGLICARTICGFLCPVGMGQELLFKIRTPKIKKSRYTRVLSYLKYVLLVVLVIAIPVAYAFSQTPMPGFCKYICPAGTFEGGIGLLLNRNNWPGGANDDLLAQLGPIFTWKMCVLIVVVVMSVFMYRPFCRFLCPLGAIYGFFNRIALLGVKLDQNKCTDCGLCVQHCKMDIKHVGDHECINCGECISVCPAKAISWKGSKIFLRKNDIDEPVVTENKPLSEIKSIRFNKLTPVAETANAPLKPAFAAAGANMGSGVGYVVYSQSEPSEPVSTPASSVSTSDEPVRNDAPKGERKESKPKKKRGRNFWIQFSAWALAVVFLGGLLIYYNVIDKNEIINAEEGTEINNILYDFDASLYGSDKTFNLKNDRGKTSTILVLFDDSEASKTQISNVNTAFGEFSDAYASYAEFIAGTELVAIHAGGLNVDSAFLSGFDGTKFDFAKDDASKGIFRRLDDDVKLPLTILLDRDGVVCYRSDRDSEGKPIENVVVDSDKMRDNLRSAFVGYKVGMIIPEFAIPLYGENEDGSNYVLTDNIFNPVDYLGEVLVINFWGTWCTPCVAELPEFNQVAKEYPDINVVAIHGHKEKKDPAQFIRDHKDGWRNYSIMFAQGELNEDETACTTYTMLGGNGTYPMTIIVGKDGVISFRRVGSINEKTLKEEIEKARNAKPV